MRFWLGAESKKNFRGDIMRKRISALLTVAAVAAFAVTGVACQGKKSEGYYLSMLDNGVWTEYKKEKDIPDEYKMTKTDDGLYGVTVTLGEGANLKVAQIGNKEKYGYTELFSSLKYITEGDDNALVAKAGEYEITFDASEKLISYTYKSKDPSGGGNQGTEADVAVVEITGDSTRALAFANATAPTLQLEAVATKDDATTTSEGITWTSSEPTVATVSESGLVTAVTAGTTQITASLGGVTSEPVTVNVEGLVTLSDSAISLTVDGTKKITPTLIGGATASGANPWSIVNTEIATVASDGTVTGVAAGTTTLRYEYLKRPGVTPTFAECSVTVATPVEGISVASELTVPQGETVDLAVGFIPADASNKNFTYEVKTGSDKITVVKEGSALKVTGNSTGEATIEVTSADGGFKETCTVTVIEEGTLFANISASSLVMNKGGSGSLTVSGSGISSVSWSATPSGIVTVAAGSDNKTATVTADGFGKATVTATVTMTSGSPITKTCEVLVSPNQMWVYGDVIDGGDGWTITEQMSGARDYDLVLTKTETGVFSGEVHLPANKNFRIAHDSFDYYGIRYEHLSPNSAEKQNVVQGGADRGNYNVQVSKTGTYRITVDFTAMGKPVLKIVCVSVDVTSVNVTSDESTLTSSSATNTAVITLTINPSDATYTDDDVVWSVTNGSLLKSNTASKDGNTHKYTVVAADDLTTGGTVTVTCAVKGKSASVNLTIVEKGVAITPVSTIEFEQNGVYAFNVNNSGTFRGTGTVKAKVNEDATNQGVTYSSEDDGVEVNATTGVVTVTKVGTYTIIATADGDSGKTTTATVTFYSDMFYLSGGANGWSDAGNAATTVGTKFENFTFTAKDSTNKKFTLDVALSSDGLTFQIMFIGAGNNWDYAITGTNATLSGASASSSNIAVSSAGLYTIELDISGIKPKVTATRVGAIPTYTATLFKDGVTTGVTSASSTVVSNRYSMSVDSAFEAGSVYSLQIGGEDVTITSVDNTSLFTLADGKLTCVAADNYRITLLYNSSDKTGTVSVEVLQDVWAPESTYGVEVYSYLNSSWNKKTDPDANSLKGYYNSLTKQYKLYFSYTFTATNESICFGLTSGGSWVKDAKSWDVTYSVVAGSTKVSSSFDTTNGAFKAGETLGTCYFEFTFTVDGSSYNLMSMSAGDNDTNPNT